MYAHYQRIIKQSKYILKLASIKSVGTNQLVSGLYLPRYTYAGQCHCHYHMSTSERWSKIVWLHYKWTDRIPLKIMDVWHFEGTSEDQILIFQLCCGLLQSAKYHRRVHHCGSKISNLANRKRGSTSIERPTIVMQLDVNLIFASLL